MSDPKEIYLGPACEDQSPDGRTWAEDNPYEDCNECGAKAVRYVLASDYDALAAECERLQREARNDAIAYRAAIERQNEIRAERDAALAELAALKGGREPDAWRNFDGEGGYDYTDDEETAERWKKNNGARYADWVEPLYLAPPAQASAWVPEDLRARCAEILNWQKTGVLAGDCLRRHAAKSRYAGDHNELQIAEAETAREAFALLAAAPTPGASDGDEGA